MTSFAVQSAQALIDRAGLDIDANDYADELVAAEKEAYKHLYASGKKPMWELEKEYVTKIIARRKSDAVL